MVYQFKCQCGVLIEHIQPIQNELPKYKVCPKCKGHAPQVIGAPTVLTGNMQNQSLDVFIGKDAEKRWTKLHENRAQRDKVRRESGKNALTSKDGGKTYQPIEGKLRFVKTPEPSED